MRTSLLIVALWGILLPVAKGQEGPVIYLFPGQGADCRQFMDLDFPPAYDTVQLSYPIPDKRESLPDFAARFLPEIDTGREVILLGVSLGGMICTEIAHLIDAEKVIIISSAKNRHELPGTYTFQQKLPINRLVPKRITKAGALLLQGIVEPDRKYNKPLFKDMLRQKDPRYLKRTVDMIINWEREVSAPGVVHIHGDGDNTIPIRNVKCDHVLKDGSHMMVLTRAPEISAILLEILAS